MKYKWVFPCRYLGGFVIKTFSLPTFVTSCHLARYHGVHWPLVFLPSKLGQTIESYIFSILRDCAWAPTHTSHGPHPGLWLWSYSLSLRFSLSMSATNCHYFGLRSPPCKSTLTCMDLSHPCGYSCTMRELGKIITLYMCLIIKFTRKLIQYLL